MREEATRLTISVWPITMKRINHANNVLTQRNYVIYPVDSTDPLSQRKSPSRSRKVHARVRTTTKFRVDKEINGSDVIGRE